MNARLLIQVFYLSRRSVVRLLRQPELIVPALLFPLSIFGFQSTGLGPATDIPGFPVNSYLDFLLAFPLVQGSLFAAVSAGTDLEGHRERLPQPPVHNPDEPGGLARRHTRGRGHP